MVTIEAKVDTLNLLAATIKKLWHNPFLDQTGSDVIPLGLTQ